MSEKSVARLPGRQERVGEAPRRRSDLKPLAFLLILPFVLFGAETLGYRVFYHHDVQYYFFPYHKLVADIVHDGHLPLWNPFAFSGIPLLGDGQTAMFYPPNWLFLVLPPIHALTLVVLLHFGIAGAGMFAYVRSLRLGTLAGLVAALAFMFNGFLVARVVHLSILAGAALVPLIFWGAERVLQRWTPARFVIAAALVGVQALAGHPQVPIYTAAGLGLYALVLALRSAVGERQWLIVVRMLATVTGIYVVGYGLAAIQLVPWIEFASYSPRAAGASYEFVTFQSLKRFDWLLFLFPYAYGGPRTSWLQSAPAWDLPVYLWERLAYLGLLPLALAVVGLAEWRRAPRAGSSQAREWTFARDRLWALTVVLVVMVLLAAGSETPFGHLVYMLPAIGKLRAYARAIVIACFALAALAAFGVERLVRLGSSDRRRVDRAPLLAAALLLGLVDGSLLMANALAPGTFASVERERMYRVMLERGLQWHQASAYVPFAFALASAGVLWSMRCGIRRPQAGAMIVVVAADLLGLALTFNLTSEPAPFERVPPSVEFLRRDPSLYRTASFISDDRLAPQVAQAQLAISWAIPYHIQDINGFNSLQPRRYTDFLFGPEVGDVSYGFLQDARLLEPTNHLLSMLDVKYALVQPQSKVKEHLPAASSAARTLPDGGGSEAGLAWQPVYADAVVTIYRNPRQFGRAYFVSEVSLVRDPAAILTIVKQPSWNPTEQALVEAGLSEEHARQLSHPSTASVEVEAVSPNELLLRTDTDRERFLVLSEMWFPGWYAEVDGRELPIYRTNYLFRGLVVPAGSHSIRMYYRPTSALVGAGITTLVLIGLGVGLGAAGMRRGR